MSIDVAAVRTWSKLAATDEVNAQLAPVVAAVNVMVDRLPIVADRTDPTAAWPEDVTLGALMLANRLHRRRNSPNGIDAMTDAGPAYVSRYDSDIARLLHIDAFDRPRVG